MRFRSVIAATSLALLLPGLAAVTASPSSATTSLRAAKITLKALPASAEVGQKVRIAGQARPAKKGKAVRVTVQRKYAGGGWETVATRKTSK